MSIQADEELVASFVGTFCKLNGGCWTPHDKPPPDELNAGIDPHDWRHILWRPAAIQVGVDGLKSFYHSLPSTLPPLYERLITSWRWLEVDLHRIRLFANPPGPALDGLAENIFSDPVFVSHLVKNGFVPFAFDSGERSDQHTYNPVCFDTNHRNERGDCPIMGFEHESMLSFDRLGDSWVLWPSFRDLIMETIKVANRP